MRSSTTETAQAEHPRVRRTSPSIPADGLHLAEATMQPPEPHGELLQVDPNKLHYTWNREPGDLAALMTSISLDGVVEPIVTRSMPDGLEIVDGRRRCEAAKKLGLDRVPVRVIPCEDAEAKILEIDLNTTQKPLTVIEFADAIVEQQRLYFASAKFALGGSRPGTRQDFAKLIGRSTRSIELLRRIAERLPVDVKEKLRSAKAGDNQEQLLKLCKEPPEIQRMVADLIAGDRSLSVESALKRVRPAAVDKEDPDVAKAVHAWGFSCVRLAEMADTLDQILDRVTPSQRRELIESSILTRQRLEQFRERLEALVESDPRPRDDMSTRADRSCNREGGIMRLTIFSWGYYGWGGAPTRFVEAVDSVERARGFEPPLFVDTRISRGVRAKGFIGDAFAQAAGKERYLWMKGLGNRSIATGTGPVIQIDQPAVASDLLARAAEESSRRRRLLFFCSCRWPLNNPGDGMNGPEPCHRHEVGSLVLGCAQGRGKTLAIEAEVIEWPGGDPVTADLLLPGLRLRELRGRKSIPLGSALPAPQWCGLPWGSTVNVRCGDGVLHVISGPASYHQDHHHEDRGEWRLPIFGTGSSPGECNLMAVEFRNRHGLNARS